MFFFIYTVNTFFFTVAGVINQCVVLFQIYRHSKKKITTGYDTFKHDHDSKKRKRDYARFFNQKKVGYHDMLETWRKLRVLHRIVGYKVAFKQPLLRERRGGGNRRRKKSFPAVCSKPPSPLFPKRACAQASCGSALLRKANFSRFAATLHLCLSIPLWIRKNKS